jgi:hypothetical protein
MVARPDAGAGEARLKQVQQLQPTDRRKAADIVSLAQATSKAVESAPPLSATAKGKPG